MEGFDDRDAAFTLLAPEREQDHRNSCSTSGPARVAAILGSARLEYRNGIWEFYALKRQGRTLYGFGG